MRLPAARIVKRRQRSTSHWPPGPANKRLPGGHFCTRAPCTPCSRGSSGGLESADETARACCPFPFPLSSSLRATFVLSLLRRRQVLIDGREEVVFLEEALAPRRPGRKQLVGLHLIEAASRLA